MILCIQIECPDDISLTSAHILLLSAGSAAATSMIMDDHMLAIDEERNLSGSVRDGSCNVRLFRSE